MNITKKSVIVNTIINVNVPEIIAKRITCVKDLNDFYAYIEDYFDADILRTSEFSYSFPDSECDRLDGYLMKDNFGYLVGEYDKSNIDRIFKGVTILGLPNEYVEEE